SPYSFPRDDSHRHSFPTRRSSDLDWVAGCLRVDFGISYVNPARTVAGELVRCLPATLQLAAISFVIVLMLSIPIGFLCAVYKDEDRQSTRLNSSHVSSSYAVFCLK